MFGPLLAITIGVVGGATTGHALLMILLISGAIVGLLSAVGGKYFWSFLARCLRVLFLMR